ncbi:hypothetical protein [Rhizobium mesosinicum]|uniref:Uncharacterized protein n=1 Tax=Rhizobium mesosinicum TaxID=335017 RepID=A0ABS7GRX6_9HYPH|nr:hypothetical protein [Rhizobium mesosinicum]MBW9052456.1 hypothetical protein [Rhizobium mesosinicum]
MSNLPNDKSCEDEPYDDLTGTYWTPPEALHIDRIHPDIRAVLMEALGRRGSALLVTKEGYDKIEFYAAGTVDMASCIPVGGFTIAIDNENNRACGVCYCDGELGLTTPTKFAFRGDIDLAFADFYCLARDEGYVS